MLLENKVAIVTGGARGIGYAIVRRFLEEGARVVIADIDHVAGPRAAAELSTFGPVNYFECDVGERLDVRNMLAATIEAFGDVDVLVNNAGILVQADLLDLEGMDKTLAVALAENDVRTRDGLAELAVDELVEYTGIDEERARELIMKARAHWFENEDA